MLPLRVRIKGLAAREWITIVAIALAAVGFSYLLMTNLSRLLSTPTAGPAGSGPADPAPTAPPAPTSPATPKIKATLFFASEDGRRLVPAETEVTLAEGVVAQARAIIEAQLSAAAPPPLVSTIPAGSTLRGIFVSERQEAFVDLDPVIRTAHPGGTRQELLTVYTIVYALLTNLPNLQEVQILIGGQEVDTLAGHVDLRRPLRKNEALLNDQPPQ